MADLFVKRGGKFLHIVFTGSSLLEILNALADLSRRTIVYGMFGFPLLKSPTKHP